MSTDFTREVIDSCVNELTSRAVSPFLLAVMMLLLHCSSHLERLKA